MATSTVSPDELIEEFQTTLSQQGLLEFLTVELSSLDGVISLDRITSKVRGKKYAEHAIKCLLSICDEYHWDVTVIPHALDDTTDSKRLEAWYMRHDFVRQDGDNSLMRRRCCPTAGQVRNTDGGA